MDFLRTYEEYNFNNNDLHQMKDEVIAEIHKHKKFDFPEIEIVIDSLDKKNKIALYTHAENGGKAKITIQPKALKDKVYLRWIFVHELIHATFPKKPEDKDKEPHHKGFEELAKKMGLPKKYWD